MTRERGKRRKAAPNTLQMRGPQLVRVPTAAAVIVVGIVVYWSSLRGQFLLDDYASIVVNPHIRDVDPIWSAVLPPRQTADTGRWRGPVVALTLAINYALGGLAPWGYHALNVAVHILAALMLVGVVRRTLLLDSMKERLGPASLGLALACALIWLVHPVLTDSVTYVIQRTTVIMGLFYLSTLYCVLRGCESRRKGLWFTVAILSAFLGMLSKEVMATAPVVIFLFDRVFIADSWRDVIRRRWPLYAGLAASWGALLWLMVTSPHTGVIGLNLSVGPADYAAAQCRIIIHYLRLALWPTGLLFDYGPAQPVSFADVLLPGTLLLLLLVGTVLALRLCPRLGFLGVWFFAILSPTSSVVPIIREVGAERRMYLPLIAVVALVVIGGHHLLKYLVDRKVLALSVGRWTGRIVVVLVVCTLSAGTIARNFDYHDAVTMWEDVIAKTPGNARAHNSLGIALSMAGRVDEAIDSYKKALALDSTWDGAHANLGKALSKAGRYDEAIVEYEEALAVHPNSANVHHSLGVALAATGRTREAVREYRTVLAMDPRRAEASFNLGRALLNLGDYGSAADAYRDVLRANRDDVDALFGLANALVGSGEFDEAVNAYRRVVRLNPRHFVAYHHMGEVLQIRGRVSEAIQAYRAALGVKADHAPTRAALAALLEQADPQ